MKKTKWFAFYWLDGIVSYSRRYDVTEAAQAAYINAENLAVLDYWKELRELPDAHKEIRGIFLNGDDSILSPNTMFVQQIQPQLLDGKRYVSAVICGKCITARSMLNHLSLY